MKLTTNTHTAIRRCATACAQELADREPEAQTERVQDHEEHTEPVDQHDALTESYRSLLTGHPHPTPVHGHLSSPQAGDSDDLRHPLIGC